MTTRKIKHQVLELFTEHDLETIRAELDNLPPKAVVNALFPLICRDDPALRWPAIICMGEAITRLAEQDLEEARIIMRRFLWSLNDESGGIGWGAPESMAETMCRQPRMATEYIHMLVSYLREDGDELYQDGNYLEHPLLQRGLLWGVARVAECRPDLLHDQQAGPDILPYLEAPDPEIQALAALAAGRLGLDAARPALLRLCDDNTTVSLYLREAMTATTVAAVARTALEALAP
ncbi:MAG: DVU0298 family protein [Desulfobulbus sp.]|jgi:hypothetical protein